MANLHIICGNCGQSLAEEGMAVWEYEKDTYGMNGSIMTPADVYITCRNCCTVHSLNQYMREEKD